MQVTGSLARFSISLTCLMKTKQFRQLGRSFDEFGRAEQRRDAVARSLARESYQPYGPNQRPNKSARASVTNTSKYLPWTTAENLKEMNGGYIGQISMLYNTQTTFNFEFRDSLTDTPKVVDFPFEMCWRSWLEVATNCYTTRLDSTLLNFDFRKRRAHGGRRFL